MKTLVSFLLDETGSMAAYKSETIAGYNEYIKELKNSPKNTKYILTKFNSANVIVSEPIDAACAEFLTDSTYKPNHMTPLYDAIGATIAKAEEFLKKKKSAWRVLFVVMTDGEENFSREHNKESIKKLIEQKETCGNWTFVYMGANQDSWLEGSKAGIAKGNTINWDQAKTRGAFIDLTNASKLYMASEAVMTLSFWDNSTTADDD